VRTAPGKAKPGEKDQKPHHIQKITSAGVVGVAHVLGNDDHALLAQPSGIPAIHQTFQSFSSPLAARE